MRLHAHVAATRFPIGWIRVGLSCGIMWAINRESQSRSNSSLIVGKTNGFDDDFVAKLGSMNMTGFKNIVVLSPTPNKQASFSSANGPHCLNGNYETGTDLSYMWPDGRIVPNIINNFVPVSVHVWIGVRDRGLFRKDFPTRPHCSVSRGGRSAIFPKWKILCVSLTMKA
jgi:hypothetical protein